jgi:hypothetical protein
MKPTSIRAPGIGYGPRGTAPSLEFQPSNRYAELLEKEQSGEKLEVPLINFSIGHWFPVDQDGFDFDGRAENEFVEATATSLSSSIVFDLNNRSVYVNVLNAYGDQYRLTWRFKEINGVIDFFADKNDTYSFIVRLKHPPKIHSISANAYGEETTTREVEMRNTVGRGVFERCLGFKMSCARVQAALHIFGNSSAVQKLTQFGVLGQVAMQPEKIKVVSELYARGDFIKKLSQIESTDVCKYYIMCKRFESKKYSKWPSSGPCCIIALRLLQMIDSGVTCCHYALADRCEVAGNWTKKDIFKLVDMYSQSRRVVQVSECRGSCYYRVA